MVIFQQIFVKSTTKSKKKSRLRGGRSPRGQLQPAERIAAMPAIYKGKCCGGTKVWGDLRGSHDETGKLFYECNGCRQRLPQPEAAATTTE